VGKLRQLSLPPYGRSSVTCARIEAGRVWKQVQYISLCLLVFVIVNLCYFRYVTLVDGSFIFFSFRLCLGRSNTGYVYLFYIVI
jgi:hypothetical protein